MKAQLGFVGERYFIPLDGRLYLSDGGFPSDPESEPGRWFQRDAIRASELVESLCVVVLGEAGAGKTVVLDQLIAAAAHREPGRTVTRIDLGEIDSIADLRLRIDAALVSGGPPALVVLDALDEVRREQINVVGFLSGEALRLAAAGARLIVTCRTAAWPGSLGGALAQAFDRKVHSPRRRGGSGREVESTAAARIVELMPLRRRDVEEIALAQGVDPARFMEQVARMHIQPLAIHPQTLGMLLAAWRADGVLPSSRSELRLRAMKLLCEEPQGRRDRGHAPPLSAEERMEVATWIAGALWMTGRPEIHLGPATEAPARRVPLSHLVNRRVGWGASAVDVDEAALRATLQSGLFTARGDEGIGFAHESFGEFLAARFLHEGGLTPAQVRSILWVDEGRRRRIAPQFREVAGWLASMDADARRMMLAEDPTSLILAELPTGDAETRALVVDAYLDWVNRDDIEDHERRSLHPHLHGLNHPVLAAQVRRALQDCSATEETLAAAIALAKANDLKEVADTLAALATDPARPNHSRIAAATACAKMGDDEATARLRALVDEHEDLDDDLLGAALWACWPRFLSARQLFGCLRPARSDAYGALKHFVFYLDLAGIHATDDLLAALDWSARSINGMAGDEASELARRIATLGWQRIDEPGVAEALAKVVLNDPLTHRPVFAAPERSRRLGPGGWQEDDEAAQRMVAEDARRRRLLIEAMVPLLPADRASFWHLCDSTRLLFPADVEWVLGRLVSAEGEAVVGWAEVARALRPMTLVGAPSGMVGLWIDAARRSPSASDVFGIPLAVKLGSDEATQMKLEYEKWIESERRWSRDRHREAGVGLLLGRGPAEAVRAYLDECLSQRPRMFPSLAMAMTVGSDGDTSRLPPADLRTSPGWERADATTRERIVEAAILFVRHAAQSEELLTQRSDDSIRVDQTVIASAVALVRNEAPASLESLSASVWTALAPTLFFAFGRIYEEEPESQAQVAQAMRRAAPETFLRCLEDRLVRDGAKPMQPSVLPVLAMLLDGEIGEVLLRVVHEDRLAPIPHGAVTRLLLEQRFAGAREESSRRLRKDLTGADDVTVGRTVATAVAAFAADSSALWPEVWSLVQAQRDVGVKIVEGIGMLRWESSLDQDRPLPGLALEALDDRSVESLTEWLFAHYPPESDPPLRQVHTIDGPLVARELRDLAIELVIRRGAPSGVVVLERLLASYGDEAGWAKRMLARARSGRVRRLWAPISLDALRAMLDRNEARSVEAGGQLLDVVVESLLRLEAALHGELPAVRDLWDKCPLNGVDKFRPKSEEEMTDYVARWLRSDLISRGLVVNREVQIRHRTVPPRDGGEPGQQTDILVEATRTGGDPVSLIVEVKGSWNREAPTAIESQLVGRYLKDNDRCRHGLLLLVWCGAAGDHWASEDPRRGVVVFDSAEHARHVIYGAAAAGLGAGIADRVEALVIDASLPLRKPEGDGRKVVTRSNSRQAVGQHPGRRNRKPPDEQTLSSSA